MNDEFEEAAKPKSKWDKFVDGYLLGLSEAIAKIQKYGEIAALTQIREPNSGLVFKLTLSALVLVFVIILSSCTTSGAGPQNFRKGKIQAISKPQPVKTPEPLYLKKNSVVIKSKERGSKTGSIWADTKPARNLYSENRPELVGESIVVSIPEELRFIPVPKKPSSSNEKSDPNSKAQVADSKAPRTSENDSAPSFRDPYATDYSTKFNAEPIKELRMEIVALEPTGDVFLRGMKDLSTAQGEHRQVIVMAKIPRRNLQNYKVDASDLTSVSINEIRNGESLDYASTGWDKVVSRKLGGFVPDVDAEFSSLDEMRGEIATVQESLKAQQKGIRSERERLLAERARLQNGSVTADKNPSSDKKAASDKGVASAAPAANSASSAATTSAKQKGAAK